MIQINRKLSFANQVKHIHVTVLCKCYVNKHFLRILLKRVFFLD